MPPDAMTALLPAGEWVHEHNCSIGADHGAFARDYAFGEGVVPTQFVPEGARRTFEGFRRANGKAGTRNYLGILTSVNCSATVAKYIAQEITRSGVLDDYPTVDGVIPFVHGTGCAMDLQGEGFNILRRTQWGYTSNPNLGGALLNLDRQTEALEYNRYAVKSRPNDALANSQLGINYFKLGRIVRERQLAVNVFAYHDAEPLN